MVKTILLVGFSVTLPMVILLNRSRYLNLTNLCFGQR